MKKASFPGHQLKTLQSERKLAMRSRTRSSAARRERQQRVTGTRCPNKTQLAELLQWVLPKGQLFDQDEFHGNVRWSPDQLAAQALVWSWQETKHVTDAFAQAQEVCEGLGWQETAQSYTSLLNALERYDHVWMRRLRDRCQLLAQEVGGRLFRTAGWVLIGFDGSRATAPRTISNERAFCVPNYGRGKRAKYGKKKSKGMRRKRNKQHPPHPPRTASVDHDAVAHGPAAALDLAVGPVACE
jgi:hypothetical protein